MQSTRTEGHAENAATSRRSNMDVKKFFIGVFILCIIGFFYLFFFIGETYLYEIPVHLGFFSAAMYFLWKRNLKTTIKSLGIPGKFWNNVKFICAGFFSIIITLFAINIIANYLEINDQSAVVDIVQQLPLYILIMAVLFAPISEEIFFRAFLVSKIGVLGSSVVFALLHISYGSVIELIGAFSIGLILALIYKHSKSIVPPIAIHMGYNLIAISVMLGFG